MRVNNILILKSLISKTILLGRALKDPFSTYVILILDATMNPPPLTCKRGHHDPTPPTPISISLGVRHHKIFKLFIQVGSQYGSYS